MEVQRYTKVGEVTFRSPINREGSWGSQNLAEDAESVMVLYFRTDNHGWIEWEIEELEMGEEIGLTFEIDVKGVRTLCDYDGVFSLSEQAVDLMREHGVVVPDEFDDRVK